MALKLQGLNNHPGLTVDLDMDKELAGLCVGIRAPFSTSKPQLDAKTDLSLWWEIGYVEVANSPHQTLEMGFAIAYGKPYVIWRWMIMPPDCEYFLYRKQREPKYSL